MAGASLVAQRLKHLPPMQETQVRSLGQEDPLEEEMATHSSILAWRIPWMEELGRLQSTGSQRVRHDLAIKHHQQQYSIVYMYHNFFIHSFVDRHLGCFHGGSKGRGYMHTYGWFMLRFDRKQQNSVKQLSLNKIIIS